MDAQKILDRLWETDPELVMALSIILLGVAIGLWQAFRDGAKLHVVTLSAFKIVGGLAGITLVIIGVSLAFALVGIIVGGLLGVGR
jgi:uncharacterized membrane protein